MTEALQLRWKGPLSRLQADDRRELLQRTTTVPDQVRRAVSEMREAIQAEGDAALLSYTERFDEVKLEDLRVPREVIEDAWDAAPPGFLDALQLACDQVRAYHRHLVEATSPVFQRSGVTAWEHRVPLERVGIYVPGGRAAYPSTAAMTVVPAQVAGVDDIVLAGPPGRDGWPHPLVLAACHLLDVEHVVPLGGAQAVLAMALGTESVPACQAVVGPGNAYVQAAKQLVAGTVRIDAPAGPSEVAALVHSSADATIAARELVAQAEHDPATLAVAVCLDEGTALLLEDALEAEIEDVPRAEIVRQALETRGALLVAGSLAEATAFLDELAPEHCILLHPDGEAIAERLRGPACIVAGPQARVPLADYAAGPSHVLPTGGHARAYSGISVDTFGKNVHVVVLDEVDDDLRKAAMHLARLEELDGHARAIEAPDGSGEEAAR